MESKLHGTITGIHRIHSSHHPNGARNAVERDREPPNKFGYHDRGLPWPWEWPRIVSATMRLGHQGRGWPQLTAEVVHLSSMSRGGSRRVEFLEFPVTEEGEYANSVLIEELQPEAREMEQLKAELESELQKLGGSGFEMSSQLLRLNEFRGEPASSRFEWHFTPNHNSSAEFSTSVGSDLHLVSPKLHPSHG
nr:Metal transporter Nramp5 [Ipomoea batatas]